MNYNSLLNLIGISIDVYGVIQLYNIKMKGLNPLSPYNELKVDELDEVDDKITQIVKELNNIIVKVNAENEQRDKNSKKFFYCILIGFIFQFISSALTLS